jgi:hypothetical protein
MDIQEYYDVTQSQYADDDDLSDPELLKRALMNEKASPEILPFEDQLVERVYLQLDHQVGICIVFVCMSAPQTASYLTLWF